MLPQPSSGGGAFFDTCNAIEVKNNVSAPAGGRGLAYALPAFGSYLADYLANCAYICSDSEYNLRQYLFQSFVFDFLQYAGRK